MYNRGMTKEAVITELLKLGYRDKNENTVFTNPKHEGLRFDVGWSNVKPYTTAESHDFRARAFTTLKDADAVIRMVRKAEAENAEAMSETARRVAARAEAYDTVTKTLTELVGGRVTDLKVAKRLYGRDDKIATFEYAGRTFYVSGYPTNLYLEVNVGGGSPMKLPVDKALDMWDTMIAAGYSTGW